MRSSTGASSPLRLPPLLMGSSARQHSVPELEPVAVATCLPVHGTGWRVRGGQLESDGAFSKRGG